MSGDDEGPYCYHCLRGTPPPGHLRYAEAYKVYHDALEGAVRKLYQQAAVPEELWSKREVRDD